VLHRGQLPSGPWVACRDVGFRSGCLKWDRAKRHLPDAAPSALTGVPRVQTLVGRFALGAGSVALSKHLLLAAKQLFLAAKHAVACMSLPRVRFQWELWAKQPGYTLWTMIR
jgi:hypothetical protein